MRGEVNRPATLIERQRSFRFSEIVAGTTPAPSDALLEALAQAMTAAGTEIDSYIPAGFTYLGQFVYHDLTHDVTDIGTPVTRRTNWPKREARARPQLGLWRRPGPSPR
jgi:hypothetical protein